MKANLVVVLVPADAGENFTEAAAASILAAGGAAIDFLGFVWVLRWYAPAAAVCLWCVMVDGEMGRKKVFMVNARRRREAVWPVHPGIFSPAVHAKMFFVNLFLFSCTMVLEYCVHILVLCSFIFYL